jgi:hypothetical protein
LETELQKHPGLQREAVAGKSVYIINRWKKDRRLGPDQLAGVVFRVPVFMDIFLHSGSYIQLNPDSGFIKAFDEPASIIGSKAAIAYSAKPGMAI